MDEVTIFDEVVLPVAAVDAWLDGWRMEYVPHAASRGLQLQGVWRGFTEDPERAVVVIQWTVPAIEGFFASRGQGGNDPRVADFWATTDELAISRSRRVLADAGLTP
jgi:hypothetical protein